MKKFFRNPLIYEWLGKITFYGLLVIVLFFLFGAAREEHRAHILREYEIEHFGLDVDTVLYNVDLDEYEKELLQRREDARRLKEQPRSVPIRARIMDVTVTRYNPVTEQCDDTPLITADGSKILKGGKENWIAISPDLLEHFSYGDLVRLSGTGVVDGVYEIHDRMNSRWTKRVDVLTPGTTAHGKWEGTIKKEPL